MNRIFACCFLCFIVSSLKSQTVRIPVSNVYTRLNTYSSIHTDAFSFAANQAALAKIRKLVAGVYGERRFMLEDLASYEFAFALPTSSGNFGLTANYFGSSSYNESQLGLAYGRNLGRVDAGVQFNYYMMRVPGYGNATSINFEGGAILHLTDQMQAGVHIYNPIGSSLGKNSEEKLPVIYSFGLGYDASEKLFIGTGIEKTENQPVNVNAGIQYSFAEKLFARTGVSSGVSSFYLGLGFLLNGFRIDVTASLHQSLGITPGLLLLYNAPSKK